MKRIEDERILNGKRKINSNAFSICFLCLWGIILYRQLFLQQEINEYLDIFLLTVGISLYVVIINILQGFYYTYRKKATKRKVIIIGAFVGAVVFTIVQVVTLDYQLTNISDIKKLLLQTIIFFVVWLAAQLTLFRISERQADKDIEQ